MATVSVNSVAALRTAITNASSGDVIEVATGDYTQFYYDTAKTFNPPITIKSADKTKPANFSQGTVKWNSLAGSEGAFFLTNVWGVIIDGLTFINTRTPNADTYQGTGYPSGIGFRIGLRGNNNYDINSHNPNFGNITIQNCTFSDWFRTFEAGRGENLVIKYNTFLNTGMDNIRFFNEIRGLELAYNLFDTPRVDTRRSNEKWYPSGGKERHPDLVAQFAVPFDKKNTDATGDDVSLANASRDVYIHHNYSVGIDHYAHGLFMFNERAYRGAHLGEVGRWAYNFRVEWNYLEHAHTNAIAMAGVRRLNTGDPLNISNNCIRTIAPNTYADTPRINIYKGCGTSTSKLIIQNNVTPVAINEMDSGSLDTCTLTDNVVSNTAWPVGWATNGPTRATVGPYKQAVVPGDDEEDDEVSLPSPIAVEYTPPTVVNYTTGNTGTTDATSHTITLPSSQVVDNFLIAFISSDGNPTLSAGADWTKLGQSSNGTEVTQGVFFKQLTSTSNTLTITSSSSQQVSYVVFQVKDGTLVEGTSSNGATANSDPPAFSPTAVALKDRLWFASRSGDGTTQATKPPADFNDLVTANAPGANSASTAVSWRLFYANTMNPTAFTSAAEQWVSSTVVVEPKTSDRVVYHGSFEGLVDIGMVETSYDSGIFKKMYTGVFLIPPTSPAYNSDTTKNTFQWIKKGISNPKPMVLANPSTDVNGWQRWQMAADFPANTPNSTYPDAHRVHAAEIGENLLEDLQVRWKKKTDADYSIYTPFKTTLTTPANPTVTLNPFQSNDWDFVEVNPVANVNRFSAKLRIRTTSSIAQSVVSSIEWSKDLITWNPTEQNGTYTPDGQKLWELKPFTANGLEHTIQYGEQSSPIYIRYTSVGSALASPASASYKTFVAPDLPAAELEEKKTVVYDGSILMIGGIPVTTVSQNRPQDVKDFSFSPYVSGGVVFVYLPNSIPEDTEYYSVGYNGRRYRGTGLVTFPYVPGEDLVTIKGVSFPHANNRRTSSRSLFFFLTLET